jgi:hypothetical protein
VDKLAQNRRRSPGFIGFMTRNEPAPTLPESAESDQQSQLQMAWYQPSDHAWALWAAAELRGVVSTRPDNQMLATSMRGTVLGTFPTLRDAQKALEEFVTTNRSTQDGFRVHELTLPGANQCQ